MDPRRGSARMRCELNGSVGSSLRQLTVVLAIWLVFSPVCLCAGRGMRDSDDNVFVVNNRIQHMASNKSDVVQFGFDGILEGNLADDAATELTDDHQSEFLDLLEIRTRRHLRDLRVDKPSAESLQQDDDTIVKLENAPIKRSKSVDSAVLGKYSIWRKENGNENIDSTVRLMRDQIIAAMVFLDIANMKNKLDLLKELQTRLKESQRALGDASADTDLPPIASDKTRAMGQVLSKVKEQLYDCKLVSQKMRDMLQSDVQVRSLKKQSTFLSQLAAKTIPNGIHCLSMRLSTYYRLLPSPS